MMEPRRLRDEAESTAELLLLEAGVSYRSSPDARAKTLAALGLAGSAAVSVGAAGVMTSSLLQKLGWSKIVLISGLGAGVAAPAAYVAWKQFHAAPVALVAPAPQRVSNSRSAAPAAPPKSEVSPAAPLEQPAAPAKAEPKGVAQSALAAELGALDAARSRLASGDASGALAKLDDYARTYPRGRLVLEAEVLRIDALSKSGQTSAAKKRAESFLRRHPNSVLASRVRAYTD